MITFSRNWKKCVPNTNELKGRNIIQQAAEMDSHGNDLATTTRLSAIKSVTRHIELNAETVERGRA
jgi:hypothetical protein